MLLLISNKRNNIDPFDFFIKGDFLPPMSFSCTYHYSGTIRNAVFVDYFKIGRLDNLQKTVICYFIEILYHE